MMSAHEHPYYKELEGLNRMRQKHYINGTISLASVLELTVREWLFKRRTKEMAKDYIERFGDVIPAVHLPVAAARSETPERGHAP